MNNGIWITGAGKDTQKFVVSVHWPIDLIKNFAPCIENSILFTAFDIIRIHATGPKMRLTFEV